MWQPNDLMRAHNIIHSFTNTPRYHSSIQTFPEPYWLPSFSNVLELYGIDKASRDCFTNFMRQCPVILDKAFSVTNVQDGWRGISPPDTKFILGKCIRWKSECISDIGRDQIVSVIDNDLIPNISGITGMLEDSQIEERLGELVTGMTEKFDFHKKPTNCQRAIWWNNSGVTKSGVLEVRRAELQRRADKTAKSAQAAVRKAQRVAGAAVLETALAQLNTGQIAPKIDELFQCECSNDVLRGQKHE